MIEFIFTSIRNNQNRKKLFKLRSDALKLFLNSLLLDYNDALSKCSRNGAHELSLSSKYSTELAISQTRPIVWLNERLEL